MDKGSVSRGKTKLRNGVKNGDATTADVRKYTKAAPFADVGKRTPVSVRFSTVVGERGSTDTARDVLRRSESVTNHTPSATPATPYSVS